MTVHSFLIFDRRGKTLFSKRYFQVPGEEEETEAQRSDQQKLIYGMLLSLKELCGTMSPNDDDDDDENDNNSNNNGGSKGDVQLIKTGAATLYNFETVSGLRFVLYTTAETSVGRTSSATSVTSPSVLSPTAGTAGTTTGATGTSGTTTTTGTPILTAATSGMMGTTTTTTTATLPTGTGGSTNTPLASPPSSNPNLNSGHPWTVVPNTTTVMTHPQITAQIRISLRHIYEHLWVNLVVRSPLYRPPQQQQDQQQSTSTTQPLDFLKATNFEVSLDNYLKGMPWFR
ncbi:sybindin-like family protein [Nitzschia inconspicua]|uniref:Sybindin-like family protein n=1 Tax=Nitzschia inconspicua TaxID=303405 RepID=A0A9K3KHG7_9STRA|nr:sybindin-like family protein [Nitzschia inconspicua]